MKRPVPIGDVVAFRPPDDVRQFLAVFCSDEDRTINNGVIRLIRTHPEFIAFKKGRKRRDSGSSST